MRVLLPLFCAILIATSVRAQKQERSLIDRLLRPDMTLKNVAQDKKFATRAAPGRENKSVGTFYVPPRAAGKNFLTRQNGSTKHLQPGFFNSGGHTVSLPQNQTLRSAYLSNSSLVEIRDGSDNRKKVDTRNFSGEHSYLAQGKSQKALDRKNAPLSIEQVRELLNKNK